MWLRNRISRLRVGWALPAAGSRPRWAVPTLQNSEPMQRTKSSLFHKLFVVLLSSAAFFTCIAWLANFRFPLAVLQTIGIVDKGWLDGVKLYWYFDLQVDDICDSYITLKVNKQVLSISKTTYFSARQAPEEHKYVRFGVPVVYRTQAFDYQPSNGVKYRMSDGTFIRRQSLRRVTIEFALWLLWPLFAAYPLWSLIRGPLTQLHRRKHGLCLNCGYSLAQLTEPRCPECGCEIESATSA